MPKSEYKIFEFFIYKSHKEAEKVMLTRGIKFISIDEI